MKFTQEDFKMLTSVWTWLTGKKLVIGAILDILSSIAIALPALLPAFGLEVAVVAQVVGKFSMVLGLLHKLYRYVYKEDHA